MLPNTILKSLYLMEWLVLMMPNATFATKMGLDRATVHAPVAVHKALNTTFVAHHISRKARQPVSELNKDEQNEELITRVECRYGCLHSHLAS